MSTETTDNKLDDATIKQLTFKPGVCQNIAVAIVRAFTEDRIAWTDEVDLSFVLADDLNCIGLAWRRLTAVGIIKPIGQFRRSTKEASQGRRIFKYRLANEGLARTFLARNGWTPNVTAGQMELMEAKV